LEFLGGLVIILNTSADFRHYTGVSLDIRRANGEIADQYPLRFWQPGVGDFAE